MVTRRIALSKVLSYPNLLALFILGLLYHFYALDAASTFGFIVPSLRHGGDSKVPRTGNIPKLLWYKLGPRGLSEELRNHTDTCIKPNPEYRATFMTDESSDAWVRETFSASRPDLVEAYLSLPVPIFKADILRYLLLWDKGGIWSDLDVSCKETPIDDWIPAEYKDKAQLVVGWEFDHGLPGNYIRQFTSWTIMSAPRSPYLALIIDDILADIGKLKAEHNITTQELTLKIAGDVVDFTGPRRLTRGIFTGLSNMLNRTVGPDDVKELVVPVLLGDVLIMPSISFALSMNVFKPEEKLSPELVTHHYAGSWKNDKGGEEKRRRRRVLL
ncbi:hypothetical protein IAQ61_011707 [Plenodomus lingam]|uniref:uncharacterized protein n=1 Tax=Leptosphaeria maculans TaxID=5022 RepID=UPI003321B6B4|nr:hypothetical protein IAQ61_011707 [Plenodomus lingam]